jgi:hypothetical protein
MPSLIKNLKTWEEIMVFELRKREADGSLPKIKDEFVDAFFAKTAPCVGQVVFQSAYPDGTPRKTGFFQVWRSPDGVTVKVTDHEVEMAWQYAGETFLDALKQVEKALIAGFPGNRSYETRSARRKKK